MSEFQIDVETMDEYPVSSDSSGTDGTENSDSVDSLDVILHLAREQYALQQSYTNSLDAKAGFILGSASLLTGVLAVWQTPKPGDYVLLINVLHGAASTILHWIPVGALGIYVVVVVCAYIAYRPLKFTRAPDLNQLKARFLSRPADETRKAALNATLSAFNQNARRLKSKARWVRIAFWALLAEAGVVAALLGVGYLH